MARIRSRQYFRSRCSCLLWSSLATALAVLAILPGPACAQMQEIPSTVYYMGFSPFHDGDYRTALARFDEACRGATKVGQTRWIDSICYYTMAGECHYHMGSLPKAVENYTAALNIFLANYDWMIRVQFDQVTVLAAVPQAPWGASTRGSRLGKYPARTKMMQGQVNVNGVVQQGGVLQMANFVPVGVQEIVRCTVLAIRRRAELLGPLARQDPLNKAILTAVSQPIGPRNHWSQAYTDLELAAALLANGKDAEAFSSLTRGTLAGGEFDHPLTATALLELGKLAARQGNYAVAAKALFESTISAFHYDDIGGHGRGFPLRGVGPVAFQPQGRLPAPGAGRPMGPGQAAPATPGLAPAFCGRRPAGGRPDLAGPADPRRRQHHVLAAEHDRRADRGEIQFSPGHGPLPAAAHRSGRPGPGGGHVLYAAGILLAVRHRAGGDPVLRRAGPADAARRAGPLSRDAPRSAADGLGRSTPWNRWPR